MDSNNLKTRLELINATQVSFSNAIGVSEGTVNRWCSTNEYPKYVDLIIDLIIDKNNSYFDNEIFLNVSSSRTFILKAINYINYIKYNCQYVDKTRLTQMNSRLRSAVYQLNYVLDNLK